MTFEIILLTALPQTCLNRFVTYILAAITMQPFSILYCGLAMRHFSNFSVSKMIGLLGFAAFIFHAKSCPGALYALLRYAMGNPISLCKACCLITGSLYFISVASFLQTFPLAKISFYYPLFDIGSCASLKRISALTETLGVFSTLESFVLLFALHNFALALTSCARAFIVSE